MTSILLPIITGFYIHRPFMADGGGFLMSQMRGTHFFAAGILIIVGLLRIIGTFTGPYRDWPAFIPNIGDILAMPKVIAYYLHLGPKPDETRKYNSMQMLTYDWILLLALFQVITGLALQYPNGWLSWFTYGFFNSPIGVRLAHYILTWLFLIFLLIHTYLGIRESSQEMKEIHLLPIQGESEKIGEEKSST